MRTFEGYSNFEEAMDRIYDLHWESGNEAHSRSAFLFKKFMERSLRSKKTSYTVETINGKRRIVKKNTTHSMGDRFSRKDGSKMNQHMGNFIQFRTYSTTGTTVVGGLMKRGSTEIRKGGKVVKKTKVFGVHQDAVDILEKISSGKPGKAKWKDEKSGRLSRKSMEVFKGTHERHPTNFIAEGKSKALSASKFRIPRWYMEALRNRENLQNSKMKKVI